MNDISNSSEFLPFSFVLSLGLHTFICGHFIALLIFYLYKGNEMLFLKIVNSIFFLAVIFLLFQVYFDLSTEYEKGLCYNDYILKKISGIRSEFKTIMYGYMTNLIGLVILIPKFFRSLKASLIISFISGILPIILLVFNSESASFYVVIGIVINLLFDGILMVAFAYVLHYIFKSLQKLKLLSQHS